jgi:hypothetical protein
MGQISHAAAITKGRLGMPFDLLAKQNGDVVSPQNELSTGIKPGYFVVQGTDPDKQVKIDDGGVTGAVIEGLCVDPSILERAVGYTYTDGFGINATVPVAKSHRWYAYCEEAAAKGGTVYVRFAAGTGPAVIGACRTDADATGGVGHDEATCDAILAKFAETTSGAGPVAVELMLNQITVA